MATLPNQTNPNLAADLYLDPDQEDLLYAALNSNAPSSARPQPHQSQLPHMQRPSQASRLSSGDLESARMYQSPDQISNGTLIGTGVDLENPLLYADLEYDIDGSFDYDDSQLTDGQFGETLPGQQSNDGGEGDIHDKRKNSEDDGPDGDAGAKRREGEEKQAKKPGRKPLTSEPTSVSLAGTSDTTLVSQLLMENSFV